MNNAPSRLSPAACIALACGLTLPALPGSAALPLPAFNVADRSVEQRTFAFEHDFVLGTQFQLLIDSAPPHEAHECERVVLNEIDRLASILSTYEPSSEISEVMRGSSPVRSFELDQLIRLYDHWSRQTDGAIDLNMAGVKRLWERAAIDGREPSAFAREQARHEARAWNVDALGKAFIIDRAVEVARKVAPSGLLNIGGDLRSWGERAWTIEIADPRVTSENAAPFRTIALPANAAIATSGGSLRNFVVAGRRLSHLIDPKTLRPVESIRQSVSVIAADCVTANALATAGSVRAGDASVLFSSVDPHAAAPRLGVPSRGTRNSRGVISLLANSIGHLIIDEHDARGGGILSESTIARSTHVAPSHEDQSTTQPANAPWPDGFEVKVAVSLKKPAEGRVRRPYVAVWITDEQDKIVRTLGVWGRDPRWQPELSAWWEAAHPDKDAAKSVSSATRPAGQHVLSWDGKNDAGEKVPQGKYRVHIEVNREYGRHVRPSLAVECRADAATITLKATGETDDSTIEYGPAKKE